ncbi:MAG: DMT family transporter [Moraxellaceae bacterium]
MKVRGSGRADLMLVGVTLLAAISWIFSREAVLIMPPLFFMALRFLFAAVLLGVFAQRELRQLNAAALWRSTRAGLVFAAGMCFWVMGIFHGTHVGEGAFLTSLGVVLVPVLAFFAFGESAPRSTWIALPVAAAGLGLLSLKHGFRPESGQLFYLSSAVIFAFYFSVSTRVANAQSTVDARGETVQLAPVPPLALTTVVLSCVGLVTLLLTLIFEPWQATLQNFRPAMAGWIVISALLGTAARFLLQTYAQSLSPNTNGVVIMVLEPVWVAMLAMLWFGESMGAQQLLGCGLIFAALLINRAAALRGWLKLTG